MKANNKKENKEKQTAQAIAEDAFHKAHAVIATHIKMITDLSDSCKEVGENSCLIMINLVNTIFSKVACIVSDDYEEAFEKLKYNLVRNMEYRDFLANTGDTNNKENLSH